VKVLDRASCRRDGAQERGAAHALGRSHQQSSAELLDAALAELQQAGEQLLAAEIACDLEEMPALVRAQSAPVLRIPGLAIAERG
jgi:hypothetical protein